MRKAAFCYLFVFLILFLAGCAGGGESVGLSENCLLYTSRWAFGRGCGFWIVVLHRAGNPLRWRSGWRTPEN